MFILSKFVLFYFQQLSGKVRYTVLRRRNVVQSLRRRVHEEVNDGTESSKDRKLRLLAAQGSGEPEKSGHHFLRFRVLRIRPKQFVRSAGTDLLRTMRRRRTTRSHHKVFFISFRFRF